MAVQLKTADMKLVAILSVIIEMSDNVEKARSPLDKQGQLLRLQNSIQRNKSRVMAVLRSDVEVTPDAG